MIKKHIPNFITSMNLFSGFVGIGLAFNGMLEWAGLMVFAGAFFDFFDGMFARLLKVSSPIGKELDSLADMVTFGVLPGIIVFQMISICNSEYYTAWAEREHLMIAFVAGLIPVMSAVRLANFNVDTRQSDSFIGVPTPANAIFFACIPMALEFQYQMNMYFPMDQSTLDMFGKMYWLYEVEKDWISLLHNQWFYLITTVVMSYLLVAEIPLLALKFKSLKYKENKVRYQFLIATALLIIFATVPFNPKVPLPALGFLVVPVIIVVYILFSVVNNLRSKSASASETE